MKRTYSPSQEEYVIAKELKGSLCHWSTENVGEGGKMLDAPQDSLSFLSFQKLGHMFQSLLELQLLSHFSRV